MCGVCDQTGVDWWRTGSSELMQQDAVHSVYSCAVDTRGINIHTIASLSLRCVGVD